MNHQNKITLCFIITIALLFLTSCVGTLTRAIEINSKKMDLDDMRTIKCAVQQAGWTITYTDEERLSGTKTVGMDNVPLSLNVVMQTKHNAVITLGSPRGLIGGSSNPHLREILSAFEACGAGATLKVTPQK